MTIVDALKNLYTAMGGNASDVADMTLNAEIINALSSLTMTMVQDGAMRKISMGTQEMTAGTTPLETGAIYLQYEV